MPLADDLPSARALLEQRFAQVQHHWDLPVHNTHQQPSRILPVLDDEGRAVGTAEWLETLR